MQKRKLILLSCCLLIVLSGCAYRHYMGFHGPSIRRFPDVHEGVSQDNECLKCHDPQEEDSSGPPTSHPHFVGCLKCHNSEVSPMATHRPGRNEYGSFVRAISNTTAGREKG